MSDYNVSLSRLHFECSCCSSSSRPSASPSYSQIESTRPHSRPKTRLPAFTFYRLVSQIHKKTGFTLHQIAGACQADRPTPRKRNGRPPILTQAQVEELVEFVCASAKNRRMSFAQLVEVMGFGVKKQAIRTALLREGFHRRLAMRKPPITEKNQRIRKAWALEHVNWSIEQWYQILWTDETWITGGRYTRTWVTRRPGEEWDPTCIVEKHQRKKGWMFGAVFMDI